MFNYLGNITDLSHHIIKSYAPSFDVAVDCTLGNGSDTDFLSSCFKKVYAFDIQEEAVLRYGQKERKNVKAVCASHADLDSYVKEEADTVIFNLGFLPGGDKSITTHAESSLTAIKKSLEILVHGGLLLVAVYVGHEEGKRESSDILEYMESLPKNEYGVMLHKVINRSENSPYLLVVEKK